MQRHQRKHQNALPFPHLSHVFYKNRKRQKKHKKKRNTRKNNGTEQNKRKPKCKWKCDNIAEIQKRKRNIHPNKRPMFTNGVAYVHSVSVQVSQKQQRVRFFTVVYFCLRACHKYVSVLRYAIIDFHVIGDNQCVIIAVFLQYGFFKNTIVPRDRSHGFCLTSFLLFGECRIPQAHNGAGKIRIQHQFRCRYVSLTFNQARSSDRRHLFVISVFFYFIHQNGKPIVCRPAIRIGKSDILCPFVG